MKKKNRPMFSYSELSKVGTSGIMCQDWRHNCLAAGTHVMISWQTWLLPLRTNEWGKRARFPYWQVPQGGSSWDTVRKERGPEFSGKTQTLHAEWSRFKPYYLQIGLDKFPVWNPEAVAYPRAVAHGVVTWCCDVPWHYDITSWFEKKGGGNLSIVSCTWRSAAAW